MADSTLYRFVKVYAAETGMTMDSIREAVGCGKTSFYFKLRGDTKLNLGEAYRLAEATGITLEKLYSIAPEINRH